MINPELHQSRRKVLFYIILKYIILSLSAISAQITGLVYIGGVKSLQHRTHCSVLSIVPSLTLETEHLNLFLLKL